MLLVRRAPAAAPAIIAPALIDLPATIARLTSFPARLACTDSERRAAKWVHDDLRARGHEAWVETLWLRPQWALSLGLHALLGVVASLVATEEPLAAAIAAGVVTASFALELAGRTGLLRWLFYRRATQIVLVEPRDPDAVTLIVAAAMDAPRRGLAGSARARRLAARLQRLAGGRAPGPLGWVLTALVAVTACAVARELGADEGAIGAVQLLPTIWLLLAFAATVDVWLSSPGHGANDPAAGTAVALAVHDELARQPADRLSAGLVIAGAGAAAPLALAAHLRRERPDPRRTILLELGPCGSGEPVWTTTHPQIAAVATRAGARRVRWHRPTAARAAARRSIPALSVRCLDGRGIAPDAVEESALLAAVDFCLAFADELSAELAALEAG